MILRKVMSVVLAFSLSFLMLFFLAEEPTISLKWMILGPFSRLSRFVEMIEQTIPLIFTGLAVSIVFQTGLFNIGAEGQFLVGAIGATTGALCFPQIPVIHTLLTITLGVIFGAVWGGIPGILKARWNASEVVSSLMMNYIGLYLSLLLLKNFFMDHQAGYVVSYEFPKTAILPKIFGINSGIILGVTFSLLLWFFLWKTRYGYEMRVIGKNRAFAIYSGIRVRKYMFWIQVLSGAVAGTAGAVEVMGTYGRFLWQEMPGYGFGGIAVSILASNNPIWIPISASIMGFLKTGTMIMARKTGAPSETIFILQSVVIAFLSSRIEFGRVKRWLS